MGELKTTIRDYASQDLPGAVSSINVVHVKWIRCPAREYNRCKGEESFPLVAFECITNNRCQVIMIALIQFKARSDKHIVCLDPPPTIKFLKTFWYKNVQRKYFDITGEEKSSHRVYLISDGGFV